MDLVKKINNYKLLIKTKIIMNQQNLFQDPVRSISYNNDEILEQIIDLHCPGGFELDPTYSIGNFYKGHISKPKYKFDLAPQAKDVIPANAENLPLRAECIKSIIFDPPFLLGGNTNGFLRPDDDNSCRIEKRYTSLKNWNELRKFYTGAVFEFHRILKLNGILVFKCQDVVTCGKNHFSHVYVMNEATRAGFYAKDLFVLLSKNRIIGSFDKQQHHARKFHSYFWVFQKTPTQNVEYCGFNNI